MLSHLIPKTYSHLSRTQDGGKRARRYVYQVIAFYMQLLVSNNVSDD
jgi:hypothetical protein